MNLYAKHAQTQVDGKMYLCIVSFLAMPHPVLSNYYCMTMDPLCALHMTFNTYMSVYNTMLHKLFCCSVFRDVKHITISAEL